MKTKEDIQHCIETLKSQLITSNDIDDVVIDGLTKLNKLRRLYKDNKSLFNSNIIIELQNLKQSIESVDQCFELIYDDLSQYNCKQLTKIKSVIPQNEYLLTLIDEKLKQFQKV